MQPTVDPILFSLGPFSVHWYGLLIVTGILLAAASAAFLAKRAGENPDYIWDMLLLVVVLAVIGARIYHVFSQPAGGLIGWDYYKEHPLEALYIWQGGLAIYGAVIGGALGVLIYTRLRHLQPLRWLDFAAPGVALGQAIGRWGNFINRELYGPPTTLPWGVIIPAENRIIPYTNMTLYPPDTLFHPTFLYESLAALALFLVLFLVAVKRYDKLHPGDLLVAYLIGYAIIRFFTEMLRPDAWTLGALAAAQVFSLVFIVGGVGFLVARRLWLRKQATPTEEIA
ncbi:MAG: prolipoprotein diacylglyceryl transferase [Anaerolineae bacterium]|jgi:phosphatidylglycerol:prolipoprotein diacylglycerol transferase|nr:prolipoprotein diacylglyceryl transferase [Anaerolineae bacterium]